MVRAGALNGIEPSTQAIDIKPLNICDIALSHMGSWLMEQIAIVTCQFQDDVECIPANQLPITMQTFPAIDPVILRDEASQCAGKSEIYFVSGCQICGS